MQVIFVKEDIGPAESVVLRRSVLDAMVQAEAVRLALNGWGPTSCAQEGKVSAATEALGAVDTTSVVRYLSFVRL